MQAKDIQKSQKGEKRVIIIDLFCGNILNI